jgi:hypothetical protein
MGGPFILMGESFVRTEKVVRHSIFVLCTMLGVVLCSIGPARAIDVKLAWDDNQDPAVIVYRLYYGHQTGNYEWSMDVALDACDGQTCRVTLDLYEAAWFFSVSAVDVFDAESELSDELATRSILPCHGDLEWDGDVDGGDFLLFTATFGLLPGDAGYNPDADFDGDTFVNDDDLDLFAEHFGRNYCPSFVE